MLQFVFIYISYIFLENFIEDNSIELIVEDIVENCAKIWATRNAIINGAKIENIILKTVNFKGLKYAPPCANCQITFESFIKSGRLLKQIN